MAENNNGEIHIDEEDVSGGSKEGVVRWILGVGLLLAIIAMSLIWIIPALSQSEEAEDISGRAAAPSETIDTQSDDSEGVITERDLGDEGLSEEPAADSTVE